MEKLMRLHQKLIALGNVWKNIRGSKKNYNIRNILPLKYFVLYGNGLLDYSALKFTWQFGRLTQIKEIIINMCFLLHYCNMRTQLLTFQNGILAHVSKWHLPPRFALQS